MRTLLLLPFLMIYACSLSQSSKIVYGPFTGHTTSNSIKVFLMIKKADQVTFILKNKNIQHQKSIQTNTFQKFGKNSAINIEFTKLDPNTEYVLKLII